MKKLLLISLALLLIASLVACAAPAPAPAPVPAPAPAPTATVTGPATTTTVTAPAPAPAPAPVPAPTVKPTYNWKFVAGTAGSPQAISSELWVDLMHDASDGRINVELFYGFSLGGPEENFDRLLKGTDEIGIQFSMTSYDPRVAISNAPYMILGWEDAEIAYEPGGWMLDVSSSVFAGLGLKYLGTWPEGLPGVATKDRYATNPEDAKDIKLRTQPMFPYPQTCAALGFQATPISWAEMYTAIQTGVIDGDSCNIIYWTYEAFRDVVDYFTYYKQMFQFADILMNMEVWNSLSAEDQEIVAHAAAMVSAEQFRVGQADELFYRQKVTDFGIEVIDLTPAEMKVAVENVRATVWPQMEDVIGSYLVDLIRANASKLD